MCGQVKIDIQSRSTIAFCALNAIEISVYKRPCTSHVDVRRKIYFAYLYTSTAVSRVYGEGVLQ